MASFTRSRDSATDGSNGNFHVGAVILQPWNSWSDHGMRGLYSAEDIERPGWCVQKFRHLPPAKQYLPRISGWLIGWCVPHPTWNDDSMTPAVLFFYGWIGHQLLPLHPSAWIEKIGYLAPCLCLSFAFGAFSAVSMIESFRPIFLNKCKSCPMIWRSRDHVGFIKFVWHFLNRDVNTLNVVFF